MPFLPGAHYRFSARNAIEQRFGQSFSCGSAGGGCCGLTWTKGGPSRGR
jgi:hypothetical protein